MFGWWRGLLAWLVVVPGVLGTVGLLKFVFFSCAGPLAATGIHSPSGHTAAAAVIYGGLCVLLLRGRVPDGVLFAVPPAFAVLFGVSRLAVHAHVPAEVLMGGGIGLAGAAVLVPAGRPPAGPADLAVRARRGARRAGVPRPARAGRETDP